MGLDMSEVQALAGKIKGASGDLGKDTTKALTKSAKAVERGAKQRAPKDTGTLQSEIYSATKGGRVAQIIAPTRYAIFNEFGTAKMAPQPFMTPALEAEAPNFLSAVEDAGTEALRKAVGG